MAFYSILSFAPLLVLITAIIGFVFGHQSANGALVSEARQMIGEQGAQTAESLLKSADKPASGVFASIIAFVTLLFGASGVFTELQAALNTMWDAPKKESSGLISMAKQRLFSFGMVLSVGFLLLISLLLSSALAFVGHSFGQVLPLPAWVLQILNFAFSFVVVTALFALMFKYLPDVAIAWRQVIVGAIGTALLFTIGKFLLGIYFGRASVGSTYGAAGSLVAVVVWIYYSAQIFFFGAEYTGLYAGGPAKESAPDVSPGRKDSESKTVGPAASAKESAIPAVATSSSAPIVAVNVQERPPRAQAARSEALPVAARPTIVNLPARDKSSKATKPRLLIAMGIGFVLGRLTRRRSQGE